VTTEPTVPLDAPVPLEDAPPTPIAPRVRWAGIVWGAVFTLLAGTALWVLAEASRREAVHEWLTTLSPADVHPGWVIGIVVLAGGLLLLILGGVALLRNAQLRATSDR
jgi:CDP-diglyceride synthetase